MNERPAVSLVATVYNEAKTIDEWLAALLAQTRQPDEIVIVDGGSDDATVANIEALQRASSVPIHLSVAPGANISEGRNLAIARATGRLIAVTDAGTLADPRWLERLIAPLAAGEADVASGFFVPRLTTGWERALAAATLPDLGDIDPDRFLPSSRSVAFRREWFDAGLRYPEWLDYCEDLVWDLAMQRAGARFRFAPDAIVTFVVRRSPAAFALQYARYARGDGKAGLFARRHALRYVTYAGLALVLRRRSVPLVSLACLLGGAYVSRPVKRLRERDRQSAVEARETLKALPLVVASRGLGDVAKMVGYPAGLFWRWRRFGGIGPQTAWRRVSPAGELFRPAALTRESQPPAVSPAAESQA
ncbi:MAG TPA: glycosyltransferase [Thermomicrobiales bacterium]|nr:glycosyltransferase [Thermomicrobiales bacterium]